MEDETFPLPHHDELMKLVRIGSARLTLSQVNRRNFVYKKHLYQCGWSSEAVALPPGVRLNKEDQQVIGWITFSKTPVDAPAPAAPPLHTFTLPETDDDTPSRALTVTVEQINGIAIAIQGHEGFESPTTVIIEMYKGRPRVIIWGDPTQGDPTHIVELVPTSPEIS